MSGGIDKPDKKETVVAWARVFCYAESECKPLTKEQYIEQLTNPWAVWVCPDCGGPADFDDAYFNIAHSGEKSQDDMPE